ncbi:MAG: GTP cyclohydrolase I FolE2 [Candidatus Thermoplasmatota archaeon]|nr:GTP cyclohydrolase I FolE2 [Candidatus Thermoplasmatota archaeon]
MIDVQERKPEYAFKLTRVGVVGIKKLVSVERGGKTTMLTPVVDAFVDLPSTKKGSHMSRNVEAINEIVDEAVRKPVKGIENLCASIAKRLLIKHQYANYAEVNMKADYFLERKSPSGNTSMENYELIAKAAIKRDEEVKKSIGVNVVGMAACPCAMETVKELSESKLYITHNQRNIASLMIEVPEKYDVEAHDLIKIVDASFSSPTYEILKRKDEAEVVMNAHKNPKFVEDIVRDILSKVLEKYKNLPDDVLVTVRSESEESIHKHNAFAERVTTLGELRE